MQTKPVFGWQKLINLILITFKSQTSVIDDFWKQNA